MNSRLRGGVLKLPELLQALHVQKVRAVVVGGVAAVVHGSSQLTRDVDVLADFTPDNMASLLRAIGPLNPRFAVGAHVPFPSEPAALAAYRNLYIQTDLGRLDVLGDSPPLPPYADLLPRSVRVEAFGLPLQVISLDDLIAVKEQVGRPKDLLVAAELRAVRESLRQR
jgi:predicted nucleotidyltransferase